MKFSGRVAARVVASQDEIPCRKIEQRAARLVVDRGRQRLLRGKLQGDVKVPKNRSRGTPVKV